MKNINVLALEPVPPLKERELHQNDPGAQRFARICVIMTLAYSVNNDIETTNLGLERG
jgi:hypothetical protein